MLKVGLAFLLGNCSIQCLARLPAPAWSIVLTGIAVTCLARKRGLLPAALLLGAAWALVAANARLAGDLPAALEGQDMVVRGYVASLVDPAAPDPQFLLDVVQAQPGVPRHLQLTWYRAARSPRTGELWELVVSLKRRNGLANPGGFDHEGYLFGQGIGAVGYVRDSDRSRRIERPAPRYAVAIARAAIAERMRAAVGSEPTLGILQGLAIGDTHAIAPAQWRVFAATGTTHIMAISGLHITMIAALAARLGRLVVRFRRAQEWRWNALHGEVVAGLVAAAVYSALAGLSIPTQRTLVMLGIYFASRWWRREIATGHALGLALIAVLLVDPFAPLAAGAWLSFGAVAVILIATSGRIARAGLIGEFTRVQIAVTVGLIPLLLLTFGSVSVVAPLANALAIPLFTLLIVPSVLLGAAAAAVWLPAGEWILHAPVKLLEWSWPLLQWLADRPGSVWHFAEPSALALVALIVGVLLLAAPGIFATRLAGALLCLPILLNRPAPPAAGDFEIGVLDVGQGLAVVVRTHAHALLYDTGPAFRAGRDAAELAILPYLHHRGVRRLDVLLISHGDLDHRGGARSILAAMPVSSVLVGPSVHDLPAASLPCHAGQHWSWDDVQFEVLHPQHASGASDNDSSCVLRVRGPAGTALLTGDIEAAAEADLVRRGALRADVVTMPHHGSRTSSIEAFVAATSPRVAIAAAGYRNRWGMPQRVVVERWRRAGARTLTTADSGAIEISLTRDVQPSVREYRKSHARYWRR